MELVIGTGNPGKLREYQILLADAPVTVIGLKDVGLDSIDVEETGETFQQNAELKALAYAEASGEFVLADDSGLCVDALDGAPGVHSARYGGGGLDDAGRRHKLLSALDGVSPEERIAHFECVIAVADPRTLTCMVTHGICKGRIAHVEKDGPEGFGYDAIFIPDGYDRTFAQLPKEVKNRISHRGEAARQLIPILKTLSQEL